MGLDRPRGYLTPGGTTRRGTGDPGGDDMSAHRTTPRFRAVAGMLIATLAAAIGAWVALLAWRSLPPLHGDAETA
jgi:hypothetical protein